MSEKDREEMLKLHKYKIWQSKDGQYWYTTFIDKTKKNGRKQVRRTSKELIEDAIAEHYWNLKNKIEEEYQSEIAKKMTPEEKLIEANRIKRLKDEAGVYKEINIWDIIPTAYLAKPNGEIFSTKLNRPMKLQIYDKTKTYAGLHYVILETKNGPKKFCVPRIICALFNGMPPEDMKNPSVDHLDSNSLNDYYENLRWIEHGANSAIRRDRATGEQNGQAKLTTEQVVEICNYLVKKEKTIPELCAMYDVSEGCIQSIKSKKNWNFITQYFDFT